MTHNQPMNDNFNAIKTEGGQRSKKVAAIFKSAFGEALEEVKAGATAVRPIAKDLAEQTAQTVREKGQEAYVNANKAARETAVLEKDLMTRLSLKLQAIIKAIRETLIAGSQDAETVAQKELEQTSSVVTLEASSDAA